MNYVIMPTCHWCHVMERESFEDTEIAELLNKNFISVKVDREERPDVDSIYMSVCQMLTGSGGWPLSIFLDAEKKPFYAGTYFPKHDNGRYLGLSSILSQIIALWTNDRKKITNASEQIVAELKRIPIVSPEKLEYTLVDKAVEYFAEQFDSVYGGFGHAPKFPSPHNLMFLLRVFYITQNTKILDMVEKTLKAMYSGGIYDHIGYGFSRYSTDEKWLIPHFEKMLYDNALLSMVYAEAYHLTKKEEYAKVVKEIFEYIKRDMTSNDGAFYSAEDADSEGIEGKFYVWKQNEILETLGKEDSYRFCTLFNITESGNFEGHNIPNLIGKSLTESESIFAESCCQKLFAQRITRIHPLKDTKIVVSWNGLMIASLSISGRVMGNTEYTELAEKCANFIYHTLPSNNNLFADDYVFFAWGLIELYETKFNEIYLSWAIDITELLISNFWDKTSAGLFLYGENSEQLIIRPKEIYDGATPSANSVFTYNLIRLARLTGKHQYEIKAHELLEYFSGQIQNMPSAYSFSLISVLYLNTKSTEIVLTADDDEQIEDMLTIIRMSKNPFMVCLLKTPKHKDIIKLAEFIVPHKPVGGKCTAYVCEGMSCNAPINDVERLKNLL